jgi:hypothetical protein
LNGAAETRGGGSDRGSVKALNGNEKGERDISVPNNPTSAMQVRT